MAFDVDILPDDPFANDLLKRREVADNLTKLIGKLTSPTVIGIDAPWGFGKTTFVKMWKQLLENDGFECIYFNAWENDFTTIPFIPFLAEFDIHFSTRIREGQGGLEGSLTSLLDRGGKIVASMIPLGKSLGAPDIDPQQMMDAVDEAAGSVSPRDVDERNLTELLGKSRRNAIKEFQEQRKSIPVFRDTLKYFLTMIKKKGDGQPVVFFVDELDRCRPTFSIELLETIKHLFNVPGVVFVLSLDYEQLSHSVKAVYGEQFDALGYLRRFFDYHFLLSIPDVNQMCLTLYNSSNMEQALAAAGFSSSFKEDVVSWAKYSAHIYNLGARDCIQMFNQVAIIFRVVNRNKLGHLVGYPFFLWALRLRYPALYDQFNRKKIDPSELITSLGNFGIERNSDSDVVSMRAQIELTLENYYFSPHQMQDIMDKDDARLKLKMDLSEEEQKRLKRRDWHRRQALDWNTHAATIQTDSFIGNFRFE